MTREYVVHTDATIGGTTVRKTRTNTQQGREQTVQNCKNSLLTVLADTVHRTLIIKIRIYIEVGLRYPIYILAVQKIRID